MGSMVAESLPAPRSLLVLEAGIDSGGGVRRPRGGTLGPHSGRFRQFSADARRKRRYRTVGKHAGGSGHVDAVYAGIQQSALIMRVRSLPLAAALLVGVGGAMCPLAAQGRKASPSIARRAPERPQRPQANPARELDRFAKMSAQQREKQLSKLPP